MATRLTLIGVLIGNCIYRGCSSTKRRVGPRGHKHYKREDVIKWWEGNKQ